ncbi:unnamed protein product [Sympodiomycopsis kandeliae]
MGSHQRPSHRHHPSTTPNPSATRQPIPSSFYQAPQPSSSPEQPVAPNNSPRRARRHTEQGAPMVGRQLLPTDPSHQYVGPSTPGPSVPTPAPPPPNTERTLRRIGPHYRRLSIIQDQSEPPSPHSPAHGLSPRAERSPDTRPSAAAARHSSTYSPPRRSSEGHDHRPLRSDRLDKPLPNPYDQDPTTVASSSKSRRRESQAGYSMSATPVHAPDPPSPLAALAPQPTPKEVRRTHGFVAPPVRGTRRVEDLEAAPAGTWAQQNLRIDVQRAQQSAQVLARGPRRPETGESWASDESTPTQSPTDARRLDRFQSNTLQSGEAQLIPVTLSPTFPRNSQAPIGHVGALSVPSQPERTQPTQVSRGPLVRQSRSLPIPPGGTSAQPHAGQAMMPPSMVRLPDGRLVPTQRNDFDNMRRFSVARSSIPGPGSSDAQVTARNPVTTGEQSSGSNVPRITTGPISANVSTQALASFEAKPTPQTSPRRSQPTSPKHRPLILAGQDPLPSQATPPSAPRLPHPLKFRKSDPVIGTPEQSRPGTGAKTPPLARETQRRSIDGAVPNRQTFGPASAIFEEAARRLHQKLSHEEAAQAASGSKHGEQTNQRSRPEYNKHDRMSPMSAVDAPVEAAAPLTEAQAYALHNSARRRSSEVLEASASRTNHSVDAKQKQAVARRTSISSEKTAFDENEYHAQRGARRASHDRQQRRGRNDPSNALDQSKGTRSVQETKATAKSEKRDSTETVRSKYAMGDDGKPFIEAEGVAEKPQITPQPSQDVALRPTQPAGPKISFPPAVLARSANRPLRPTTGGTVRSGLSFHSKSGHQRAGDICPHCFRAGFDCALNLHTGTGGQGRKSFQQFVQSGIAGLLSAPNSPSLTEKNPVSRPVTRGSSRASNGGSQFFRLGSVAFGESALSRPVTRGRVEDLLAERDYAARDVNEKVSYDEFVKRLQEEEHRQIQDEEKQTWKIAMDGQGAEILTEKKDGDQQRRETPPMTPGLDQLEKGGEGYLQETWQRPTREALMRRETNRTIISTIDQASIRSEGQFTIRTGLTFGFFGAVLFAVQILDSGLSGPMNDSSLDQPPDSAAAMGGRLAFFWGEAIGIFLGAFLYRFGPWILVANITLAGVFALVAGFSQTYFALNILRGLIGLCGGVIFMFSIGNLLDMLPSSRNRYLGLLFLISLISIPQLTGPWVAQAFQDNLSWRWLYWAAAIATACAVPFLMLLAREPWLARVSTPNAVHDGRHGPGQGFRVFILPFSLLVMHPHLLLSSISTMFGLSIFTLLLINIHSLWVDTYHFTDTQAGVATTICSLLGLITALLWTLTTAAFRADKPKRRLHLDEDGYIRVTPSKRPEQRLFKVAGGLLMSAITLFLIAITVRTSVHWVAAALLFTILAAGVILSIIGALHYPIEVYHPASALIVATSSQELPNLQGLTEEQHWGRQFTLSAVAGLVGVTLSVVGIMTFIAPAGLHHLGFSTLCVVLACCALVAAGTTVLLLRLGAGMRQKAWRSHHDSMRRAEEWRAQRREDAEMGLGFSVGHHDDHGLSSNPSPQQEQPQQGQQSGRQSSQQTFQRPSGSQQAPVRPALGPLQPSGQQSQGEIIGQIPNVVNPSGGYGIGPGTPPVSAVSRRLSTAARTNSRMSVRDLVTRGKSSWSQMSGRYPILPQISPSDRPSFVTQLPLSLPLAPALREEMMQVGLNGGSPALTANRADASQWGPSHHRSEHHHPQDNLSSVRLNYPGRSSTLRAASRR